jgi:hypothetical protein
MPSPTASHSTVAFPPSPRTPSPTPAVRHSKRVSFDASRDTVHLFEQTPEEVLRLPSCINDTGIGSTRTRHTSSKRLSLKGRDTLPEILRAIRKRVGSTTSVSSIETIRASTNHSGQTISGPRPLQPSSAFDESTTELKRKRRESTASMASARRLSTDEADKALADSGSSDAEEHRTVRLTKKFKRTIVETLFKSSVKAEKAVVAPVEKQMRNSEDVSEQTVSPIMCPVQL